MKAHLPEALKQQLQAYEREKKDSPLSYPAILEQRILTVDRDMVEKFSASHDEAGEQGRAYVLGWSYLCALADWKL